MIVAQRENKLLSIKIICKVGCLIGALLCISTAPAQTIPPPETLYSAPLDPPCSNMTWADIQACLLSLFAGNPPPANYPYHDFSILPFPFSFPPTALNGNIYLGQITIQWFYLNYPAPNTAQIPITISAAAPDAFSITLSGGNEVEPSNGSSIKTLPFIAIVKDQSTGQPPTNPVKVHISLKVDSTSGGHVHGTSDRPRGGIAALQTCTSDAECWSNSTVNGSVMFNFNAPEASGKYTITATCDGCTNNPQMATVNVKVDELAQIPDAPYFYTFIGATTEHNDNHYLTSEAATNMLYITASYRTEARFWKKLKGKKPILRLPMRLNDASLIWGGLFDIKGKWKPGHQGHRRGVVIDVKANDDTGATGAIPLSSFDNFKKMALKYYGADAQIHCTSNKTDGQNRKQPTCVGKDGSQDPNRHFHILLLGDDQ